MRYSACPHGTGVTSLFSPPSLLHRARGQPPSSSRQPHGSRTTRSSSMTSGASVSCGRMPSSRYHMGHPCPLHPSPLITGGCDSPLRMYSMVIMLTALLPCCSLYQGPQGNMNMSLSFKYATLCPRNVTSSSCLDPAPSKPLLCMQTVTSCSFLDPVAAALLHPEELAVYSGSRKGRQVSAGGV